MRYFSLAINFLLIISILVVFSETSNALAQTMSNSEYVLRMGNFNVSSGKPSGPDYSVSFTAGQLSPGLYTGSNYKVRAGFQYIYSIIPFTFRISQILIDFGTLSPTNPVTRSHNLILSNGSAYGYSVTLSQNHPLRVNATGIDIPNTTCDDGTCTPTTSAAWTSSLVYGLGYRCDNVTGTDCATGFASASNFKSLSSSPSATTVMTGANVGRSKEVQISFKVNVSQTQAAGLYTNILNYIATPTY